MQIVRLDDVIIRIKVQTGDISIGTLNPELQQLTSTKGSIETDGVRSELIRSAKAIRIDYLSGNCIFNSYESKCHTAQDQS